MPTTKIVWALCILSPRLESIKCMPSRQAIQLKDLIMCKGFDHIDFSLTNAGNFYRTNNSRCISHLNSTTILKLPTPCWGCEWHEDLRTALLAIAAYLSLNGPNVCNWGQQCSCTWTTTKSSTVKFVSSHLWQRRAPQSNLLSFQCLWEWCRGLGMPQPSEHHAGYQQPWPTSWLAIFQHHVHNTLKSHRWFLGAYTQVHKVVCGSCNDISPKAKAFITWIDALQMLTLASEIIMCNYTQKLYN